MADVDAVAYDLLSHLGRQCEAAMRVEWNARDCGDLMTAAIGAEAAESASALAFDIAGVLCG